MVVAAGIRSTRTRTQMISDDSQQARQDTDSI